MTENFEVKDFSLLVCICIPSSHSHSLFCLSVVYIHSHTHTALLSGGNSWLSLTQSLTSNLRHSKKSRHHFEGHLPIREVNAFAPFSGRGYLILVMAGQENWPPVPNFMWNFFPDRGSDPVRRIQVCVKSYLTWWWMTSYLGVSICPDKVSG